MKATTITSKFSWVVFIMWICFSIEATAQDKTFETNTTINKFPSFYNSLINRLEFSLSWSNYTQEDYFTWQQKARNKVMECLMTPPPNVPFAAITVDEQDRGTYIARKIVFNITGDSRVLAFLLVPKSQGIHPTVLLLHDHGAMFDIGKEKVIEPWNEPTKKMDTAHRWVTQCYGGKFIGDELAQRGYVCLAVGMLNWSDRGGAGSDGQSSLASGLLHYGSSFAGLIAFEDIRAAEFLSNQPEVDSKRIAAIGLSVGDFRTWQIAALSEHIAAGVSVC